MKYLIYIFLFILLSCTKKMQVEAPSENTIPSGLTGEGVEIGMIDTDYVFSDCWCGDVGVSVNNVWPRLLSAQTERFRLTNDGYINLGGNIIVSRSSDTITPEKRRKSTGLVAYGTGKAIEVSPCCAVGYVSAYDRKPPHRLKTIIIGIGYNSIHYHWQPNYCDCYYFKGDEFFKYLLKAEWYKKWIEK